MDAQYGSIEKQTRVDAPTRVVYEVISSPEHIAAWWFEAPIAAVAAVPGARVAFLWVTPPAPAVRPEHAALLEDCCDGHDTVLAGLHADLPAYVASLAAERARR